MFLYAYKTAGGDEEDPDVSNDNQNEASVEPLKDLLANPKQLVNDKEVAEETLKQPSTKIMNLG